FFRRHPPDISEVASILAPNPLLDKSRTPTTGRHMNLAAAPTAVPDRRRWTALMVVCLAQLMIVLDVTIVNVALPSIQHDLHFSQGNLTWVVNAFLITFGSLLLLAGRLGDLAGRKRVFLAGLVTFTLASVICGLASTQAILI